MAITILTQASAGAPTYNGAAGSLIGVLDFCLVTTLGWTKAFSGTNLASYRPATGNRFYLGVDDTPTLNSRIRGFETMTAAGVAVGSGTGPFPTDAQLSGGAYLYKSSDTTTARNWLFVSNGTMFHFVSEAISSGAMIMSFGDFASFKAGDGYNTLLSCAQTSGSNSYPVTLQTFSATPTGSSLWVPRSYTQIGGSVWASRMSDAIAYSTGIGSGGITYPSPIDGGLIMYKVQVGEQNNGVRGEFLGLWSPIHNKPLTDGDTFTGNGNLAGKTFIAKTISSSYQVIIETSDTWGA